LASPSAKIHFRKTSPKTKSSTYDHLTYTGPSFERLSLGFSCLGPLNPIFRSRGRAPDLGEPFSIYSGRYGSMWTKFQLKPLVLDLKHDIYVDYAFWGGGPLALSLRCCQELLDDWSKLRGTVF